MNIESNQCYLDNNALSTIPFHSKDDSYRPILSGLYIKSGKAYCADGYMLATSKVEQGKDFPDCVIPCADLLQAERIPHIGGVLITKESNHVTIAGKFTIIAKTIDGKYPDAEKLFDIASPVQGTVGLQRSLLKKLVEAMDKGDYQAVYLRIRGTDKPVEFCVGMEEPFKGILMPYYLSCKEAELPWGSKDYPKPRSIHSDTSSTG